MEIKFLCTYWGREHQDAETFLEGVLDEGYDGVEVNVPSDDCFRAQLSEGLARIRKLQPGFVFYAQQVLPPAVEDATAYCDRMLARLEELAALRPQAINAHTGKDHFSFEDNCRIIEAAEAFSRHSGIPVYHEIHRGRFSFHAPTLMPYLERFAELQLTADYSHWCTVSESMLEDQEPYLLKSFPHVAHLHARVGGPQSPQLADPFAPECAAALARYTGWWRSLCRSMESRGVRLLTITPESGPAPYMPAEPHSARPLANQHGVNLRMKQYLQQTLTT
ncbi:MAG: sugar phosphate isomerase/epimerase [Chitinophagaceae bacterium]|nr:MAG: sugar phosphate isomerase/epimerase [Chitinophagaceae bacterium]